MKGKKIIILGVTAILGLGIAAPAVSVITSPVYASSTDSLNPSKLQDGTYEVQAAVLKTRTTKASASQTFFDKTAVLTVKNGKIIATMHLISNKSMLSNLKLDSNQADLSVTSTGDNSEDIDIPIDDLSAKTTIDMKINITATMAMNQKADIGFDPSTLKVIKLDESNSSETSSESSSTSKESSAVESSSTSSSPTDVSTDSSSDGTSESSSSKSSSSKNKDDQAGSTDVDNSATSSSKSSSKSSANDSSSTATSSSSQSSSTSSNGETNQSGTNTNSNPTGNNNPATTPSDTDGTNLTKSPLFDPNDPTDGIYQVPYTINKAGSDQLSLANTYFSGNATVVVFDGGTKETVTLHVTQFASLIRSFSIGSQSAQVSKKTDSTADLTFNVDKTFSQKRVSAQMAVMGMNQKADIVFGTALSSSKALNTNNADSKTPPAANSNTSSNSTNSSGHSSSKNNSTKVNDNQISALIYKADASGKLSSTPSAAQQFVDKQVTIVKSADGQTVKVTFHTTGANYINQMRINNKIGVMKNKSGNNADIVFNVPVSYLNTAQPAYFSLTIPGGIQMQQEAFILFGIDHAKAIQKTTATAKMNQTGSSTTENSLGITLGHKEGVLDANKEIQYVPYAVWDQSRSALSTANNYYTHSAKVVKSGSGYDVYLTVQETAGVVKFTPVSVNNGGISNYSKSTQGNNDVWQYSFHIADVTGLSDPIPAQIMMSVPMANISNQQFSIWLAFGKTQSGGTNYANNESATALPATSIALANSNAGTSVDHLVTTSKKTVKNTNSTTSAKKNSSSATTDEHLPKLKDYPFIAEIAGFSALSIAIIGLAFFKKLH